MLILSRKENESITIGDSIKIKVIGIDKGSVKLGFEAPPEMLILREELKIAIQEENKKSLQHSKTALNQLSLIKKKV
ncbi:carbon storage regulator CsrA [Helicobacter winghamensis]|uniref:Translational regulator CsrA n=1 Tax=Helicobacter winghamensis TaxID=157268 RepID=A0A2N3PL62_9HELI|nr:carbon storage regulator CsrA [Helicobacter winghamensis]EEO26612.1 carbon storage regulator [Helicobacter winghamensis ATCC BAA-430]PKT79218.1 carbon storage regulator [Helicobacter winghamensis]PKT79337.1 carbon storage regulator [Helicobacter winghamensis]PKT79422.1 carbon storage regulator [Helicobacter winghamensis]PKT82428.1 carbon storage regulator [Helicobacter winghamensis]